MKALRLEVLLALYRFDAKARAKDHPTLFDKHEGPFAWESRHVKLEDQIARVTAQAKASFDQPAPSFPSETSPAPETSEPATVDVPPVASAVAGIASLEPERGDYSVNLSSYPSDFQRPEVS